MQHLIYVLNPSVAPDALCINRFGYEDDPKQAFWRGNPRREAVLHFVLKGSGYLNGVRVKEGQGFYIPSDCVFEYHPAGEDPWYYFWVDMSCEFGRLLVQPMIDPDQNGIFQCPYIEKVARLCSQLMEGSLSMNQADAMYHTFGRLRLHQSQFANVGAKQEVHVRKAKEYIETHLSEKLTVIDVAKAVYLNPQYLSTLFAQYEGMTTKEYILSEKLHSACGLLIDTRLQIKEIARDLGFSDIYTFSKLFKAKIGISPREYRVKNS